MTKYHVYFWRKVCIAEREVEAKDEYEAERKAGKTLYKIDFEEYDEATVEELDE